MNRKTLTIWEDDLPEEIIERITFILSELGVSVIFIEKGVENEYVYNTYEIKLSEILPEMPEN